MKKTTWKFDIGDRVTITSYLGPLAHGIVAGRYVPTHDEHVAGPHERYKVAAQDEVHDVSDIELVPQTP